MDLSTNHLLLGGGARLVLSRRAGGRTPIAEATETVDLVGPLCNSDEVGAHRKMPPLARGDYVAFLDAGGYTESCAARYNAQLLPATVLVSGDRAEVITEREQLQGHRRPLPRAAAPARWLVRADRRRCRVTAAIAVRRTSTQALMDLGLSAAARPLFVPPAAAWGAAAFSLAREGVDVTLVARTADALERTAEELRCAAGVQVTAVAGDINTDDGRDAALAACPEPDILVEQSGRALRCRATSGPGRRRNGNTGSTCISCRRSSSSRRSCRACASGGSAAIVNMSGELHQVPAGRTSRTAMRRGWRCRAPWHRWCASWSRTTSPSTPCAGPV